MAWQAHTEVTSAIRQCARRGKLWPPRGGDAQNVLRLQRYRFSWGGEKVAVMENPDEDCAETHPLKSLGYDWRIDELMRWLGPVFIQRCISLLNVLVLESEWGRDDSRRPSHGTASELECKAIVPMALYSKSPNSQKIAIGLKDFSKGPLSWEQTLFQRCIAQQKEIRPLHPTKRSTWWNYSAEWRHRSFWLFCSGLTWYSYFSLTTFLPISCLHLIYLCTLIMLQNYNANNGIFMLIKTNFRRVECFYTWYIVICMDVVVFTRTISPGWCLCCLRNTVQWHEL